MLEEKMKNVLILLLLLLIIASPLIEAREIESTLKIKSEPYYSFVIRVQDASSKEVLTSVYGQADETGYAEIPFNTTVSEVMFTIIERYDHQTIDIKETAKFKTNGEILVDIRANIPIEENITLSNQTIINQTIVNEINQTNATSEANSQNNTINNNILGNVILKSDNPLIKNSIYIIAGMFLLLIVVLIARRIYKKIPANNLEFKNKKNNDKKDDGFEEDLSISEIEKAEKKLEDARRDINEIKRRVLAKEEAKLSEEQKR